VNPKPDRPVIIAAGAVVLRAAGDGAETLLVHRPRYNDWSFPKGKLNAGERAPLAACREVAEETGCTVRLGQPLSDRTYEVDGSPKVVHYWQAEVLDQGSGVADGFQPNAEVDEIAWLPLDAAARRLTQDYDRELLAEVTWPPTTALVLLRHAKAVKRSKWEGVDDDRPLDDIGRQETEAIADLLGAYGVTRVHSSDWTRCLQTVEPYARRHDLPVVPEPGLTEEGFEEDPDAGVGRLQGLLAETDERHEPSVLCSHRPVLPVLIEAMLGGTRLRVPKRPLTPGSMLVAHLRHDRPVALELHKPQG
jgi:8-oxo-(d)GTP phosphatase